MAYKISEDCIMCGSCINECPTEAISEGDPSYVINPNVCVECVGFFDESQCASVCPVSACVPDPEHKESKDELLAKKQRLGKGVK